jgi:hypothetical protein
MGFRDYLKGYKLEIGALFLASFLNPMLAEKAEAQQPLPSRRAFLTVSRDPRYTPEGLPVPVNPWLYRGGWGVSGTIPLGSRQQECKTDKEIRREAWYENFWNTALDYVDSRGASYKTHILMTNGRIADIFVFKGIGPNGEYVNPIAVNFTGMKGKNIVKVKNGHKGESTEKYTGKKNVQYVEIEVKEKMTMDQVRRKLEFELRPHLDSLYKIGHHDPYVQSVVDTGLNGSELNITGGDIRPMQTEKKKPKK